MSATVTIVKLNKNFIIDSVVLHDAIIKEFSHYIDETDIEDYKQEVKQIINDLLNNGCIESEIYNNEVFELCSNLLKPYIIKKYELSTWNNIVININHTLGKVHID